ncbi:hypothetical protein HY229_04090 [Candidatus Acetothermia bacterium]|nr:hypothetical protein [Candidatus Acetothermia bacterium]MBI3643264.1 hypothetical protein [Candidatus Acetothermia bacterium]
MRREYRWVLAGVLVVVCGSVLFAQTSDYFSQYPGGFTQTAYEVLTADLQNPLELGWKVEETADHQLMVTTTNQVLATRNEMENGVVNGIAQTQLIIQDEAVRTLLQNHSSLTPSTTFIVPGGAHFVTGAQETIEGVSALCGVLTTDAKPAERTILAITADPTLPFPPFIQLQKTGENIKGTGSNDLPFCTSVLSVLQNTSQKFTTTFQLRLTAFERRE